MPSTGTGTQTQMHRIRNVAASKTLPPTHHSPLPLAKLPYQSELNQFLSENTHSEHDMWTCGLRSRILGTQLSTFLHPFSTSTVTVHFLNNYANWPRAWFVGTESCVYTLLISRAATAAETTFIQLHCSAGGLLMFSSCPHKTTCTLHTKDILAFPPSCVFHH